MSQGKLASPDTDMEMRRPVVMFSAASPDRSIFFHSDNCDAEGKFACVVPAGCKLELSIAAENFAFTNSDHQIDAPLSSNSETEIAEVDLGKLILERGVSVVGSAKLKDGSPASGVVIGIVEGDPESADGISHVSGAKTDAKGDFKLPPHLGRCRLYVLKSLSESHHHRWRNSSVGVRWQGAIYQSRLILISMGKCMSWLFN